MANVNPAANPYAGPKAAVAEGAGEVQPVRIFATSGRIGRARYIAYGMAFWIIAGMINTGLASAGGQTLGPVLGIPVFLAFVVIGFMLTIQRCHDFNTSGWLSILALVPFVNLIFWFIPGSDGPNRYGPPTPPNSVGVLIAVWIVPALAIVGIAAAVAIPAYQDYTHRARISEGIMLAVPWREAVTQHYGETKTLPSSVADLRKEAVPTQSAGRYSRVALGANGVVTVAMANTGQSALEGKTIVMQPIIEATGLRWSCGAGTLERKYRPAMCRD
jgi:uncharacterized membrane protein YhaH (DUF805 family)/Tfp pilus assembly major pilin PilA